MANSRRANMVMKASKYGLSVDTWNPGDGYTHYRFQGCRKGSCIVRDISHYLTLGEAEEWLEGYTTALDLQTSDD